MGTTFETIYKKFLSNIDDPTLAEMTDEDATEIMHEMLIASIASVREFKENGFALNESKTAFVYNLSEDEQEVLALGMVEKWQGVQTNSITLTKHFITSKEQLFFAQHNHLNGLLNLKKETFHGKERIRSRYKTLHNSYLGTEEEPEADESEDTGNDEIDSTPTDEGGDENDQSENSGSNTSDDQNG